MNTLFRFSLLRVLPVAALILFSACSDNPADHDDHDHEEHADAEGLRVMQGSAMLYQVLEGAVTCDSAPCGITVSAGQSITGLEVAFVDHDGDEIHGEDLDDEFSLGFSVANASVATIAQNGRWGIDVSGVSTGTTAIQLMLNHDGHADLTTPPTSSSSALTITVTQ